MVDVQRRQKRFDRMISGHEAHLRVASRGFIGGLPHSLWQPLQLHTLRSLSQADEVVSNTGRQSVQLLRCEVPYSSPREQLEQLPVPFKKAHLEIFPCTVSQLLAAPQLCNDCFTICDCELKQVSVVGVIRGFAPFVTNVQYAVDDMTGPPLNVKLWVNMEDSAQTTVASPGMYVKVIGSLRSDSGQRSLLAMNVRRIKDLNEISSHMLEVVQAHMQVSRKVFDVNMNTTVASQPDWSSGTCPQGVLPNGLSTVQGQVLHQIQVFSVHNDGISFHDLTRNLDYISMRDIRSSLVFLASEGHIFSTSDEHHFKAA